MSPCIDRLILNFTYEQKRLPLGPVRVFISYYYKELPGLAQCSVANLLKHLRAYITTQESYLLVNFLCL